MVLLGQSWGGCLALQYTLDHPDRVQGLVLSNTGASIPLAFTEMSRLRVELGPERYMRMIDAEARGDFEDPGYQEAVRGALPAPSGSARSRTASRPSRPILEEDVGPAYLPHVGAARVPLHGRAADLRRDRPPRRDRGARR